VYSKKNKHNPNSCGHAQFWPESNTIVNENVEIIEYTNLNRFGVNLASTYSEPKPFYVPGKFHPGMAQYP